VVSRGSLATRRHGAVPWRDGATAQPLPPWSSYARESHAPSNGGGGWVGRYAWASNCPGKRITALRASFEYSRSGANQAKFPFQNTITPHRRRAMSIFEQFAARAKQVIAATNRLLHFRESSASLAALLRVHRICIVNSSKNLSIAEAASRVFTSSGATRFFADKAAHSMLPSVLVSAPFTTEFSGVMPNSGLIERQRTDSPSRRDSGRGAKEAKS
jgi:hypothetical protein